MTKEQLTGFSEPHRSLSAVAATGDREIHIWKGPVLRLYPWLQHRFYATLGHDGTDGWYLHRDGNFRKVCNNQGFFTSVGHITRLLKKNDAGHFKVIREFEF